MGGWCLSAVPVDLKSLAMMNAIDREMTAHPFFGACKILLAMRELGFSVNHGDDGPRSEKRAGGSTNDRGVCLVKTPTAYETGPATLPTTPSA
jgi:hypothetical protein